MFKAATEKVQVVQDDELKFKVQYLDSFQYSNIQILNFHISVIVRHMEATCLQPASIPLK